MTHVTCRLTARNRDQLRNPTLCNRGWTNFFYYLNNYTLAVSALQLMKYGTPSVRVCTDPETFLHHLSDPLFPADRLSNLLRTFLLESRIRLRLAIVRVYSFYLFTYLFTYLHALNEIWLYTVYTKGKS